MRRPFIVGGIVALGLAAAQVLFPNFKSLESMVEDNSSKSSVNKSVSQQPLDLAQDPLTAFREPHKMTLSDVEFEEYIKSGREKVSAYGRQFAPDHRGYRLVCNLNTVLPKELSNDTLIIILTGNLHTPKFEHSLNYKFNTYFFSESSYLDRESEHKEKAKSFTELCVRYHATSSKPYDSNKPDCIIFGDNHGEDFEFEKYMPTPETIKNRGIRKIIFAGEHYDSGKPYTFDDMKKDSIESYGRMARYLERMKDIEIELVGMEY
jgi:hypothetical protein